MSRLKKYEQYEGILKEVYHLSKIRKSEEKVDVIDRIKSGQPYSDKVYDFLMQTDLDTVKFVQTVMYLGRDYKIPKENEYEIERRMELAEEGIKVEPKKLESVANPDRLIDEYMADLTKAKGWKSQDIEAYQVSSKSTLDKYMERAFKILGI